MESKIPILFVISNAEFSGAERQLLLLASHLDKTKFEPEVCCMEGEGTFTDAVKETKLPLHIIRRKRSIDLKRFISLFKLIRKRKYQIVHSFTWSANQYARLSRLFANFNLISGERGRDLELINLENLVDKLFSPMSDYIVFNSVKQHDKYAMRMLLRKIPLRTIYNGIDIKNFQSPASMIMKRLLGLGSKERLIGTVGNFTAHKNFDMFINVCEKMISLKSDVHFVAIGDGREKAYYKEIIHRKGLEEKLSLIGRREDIEKLLSEFDLFLLTSTWEGMPNVIMEAMASGVPVISTNVDGCSELIQDSVNGFLVNSNDIDCMVSKIMLLLEDSDLQKKVIQNGLQTIQSKFSLEKMVNAYETLYLNLNIIEGQKK